MKKLILPLFVGNSLHIAAGLESAIKLHKDFSILEIHLLASKTPYPSRMSRSLDFPTFRSNRFFKKLDLQDYFSKVDFKYNLEFDWTSYTKEIDSINSQLLGKVNLSDLMEIQFNEINLGGPLANAYAAESIIDSGRELNSKLLQRLAASYLRVFLHAKESMLKSSCELLIYNGRFLHERAFLDASKSVNSKYWIYETTQNRFHLRNEGFHDRKRNQFFMVEHWQKSQYSVSKKCQIAAEYFETLKSPRNKFFTNLATTFNHDLFALPYLVYYSNSDDEAIGFWDSWQTPLGPQVEVVKQLREICKELKIRLIIRLHPNLKNKAIEIQNKWREIPSDQLCTVIEPENPLSSYELLEKSMGVLTFGSTMGLEAAYYKKPSAVLADCLYDELGAVDKIESFEDLRDWIMRVKTHKTNNFIEERRIAACVRGFWQRTGGSKLSYTLTEEVGEGAFRATSFQGNSMRLFNRRISIPILSNSLKRSMQRMKLT